MGALNLARSLHFSLMLLSSQAFVNERLAPEILPYETDLVSSLQSKLAGQEADAAALAGRGGPTAAGAGAAAAAGGAAPALAALLTADAARARYLLAAYHRARLGKIEKFATHVLDCPAVQARLAPPELTFARTFFLASGRHLKAAAASRLPPDFVSLVRQSKNASEEKDMVRRPALGGHVIARALEDRGAVAVGPPENGDWGSGGGGDAAAAGSGEVIQLLKGDVYALRYGAVRDLLAEDWVALV